ncbi:hypothetical protein AeNC1_007283, partial [Aphanomyces euteiches]
GLFIGISLEGSVIVARPDVNREFYGKDVTAAELLSGQERPPIAAQPLYDALESVAISPANGLNRAAAVSAARYAMSQSMTANTQPAAAASLSSGRKSSSTVSI